MYDLDAQSTCNQHGCVATHEKEATRYGLVGPGIESLWGRDLPHPSRPALAPTQPPIQWVPYLYQR